jgi:hypothetical protein
MYNAYCKLCSELLLNKDVCSETHPVYGLIMPKTQEAIVEEHYQKTHNPKQHRSKPTYAEYKTEHIQEFPLQNSGNSSGQPATKWCLVCGQKCTVENLCGCNTLPYSNRAPHSIKCCHKTCGNILSTTNMSYHYCHQHLEKAERCSTKSTENEACPNPIAFKGTRYCGRHLETCWVEGCEHPISHPKTSKFCPDHARFSDAGASAPPPPRQKCSRCKAGEVFQNSLCQSCHQSQAEANFSDFVDAIVSAPTEHYFLNEMP